MENMILELLARLENQDIPNVQVERVAMCDQQEVTIQQITENSWRVIGEGRVYRVDIR